MMAVVGAKNHVTLYDFLLEAELGHYYDSFKNDLKIQSLSQLKYVEEEDLLAVGLTKPEQRRLRKFFEKYYPKTYLNKIKKMMLTKNEDGSDNLAHSLPNGLSATASASSNSSNFIRGLIDVKNGGSGAYSSKRRLKPELISRPQSDLKHTGHVGADGAFFGDISFLGDKHHQVLRYCSRSSSGSEDKDGSLRSSSDLSDKTPLLTRSCAAESSNGSNHFLDLTNRSKLSSKANNNSQKREVVAPRNGNGDHEYHEISDEEGKESPRFETFDFGPSLMDEVFRELDSLKPGLSSAMNEQQQAINDSNVNVKNEIREMATILAINSKEHGKKKHSLKPISAADEQNLDSAIAMAKKLACQSMHDLDGLIHNPGFDTEPSSTDSPKTPTTPNKHTKKFSFKFKTSPKQERRKFSEEAEKIADIQSIITEEAKEAYISLIERPSERRDSLFSSDQLSQPSQSQAPSMHIRQDSHDSTDADNGDSDANPLRMLRNGLMIPRVRGNKQRVSSMPQTASLAKLTSVNRSALGTPPPVPTNGEANALPLPPRDRSKPPPVLKHHQRKHVLVLPNSVTGSPNGSSESLINDHGTTGPLPPVLSSFRPHMPVLKQVSCPEAPASFLNGLKRSLDNNENSSLLKPAQSQPPPKPTRTFISEESFESQIQAAIDNLDSVAFESNGLQSKTQNNSGSYGDLLDFGTSKQGVDQLNGNRSNMRGPGADEVRIMQNILANEVNLKPEECVIILDGTNWDVHKAIKCIRLRETLKVHSINLNCNWIEIMSRFNWNVRQASNYLIATQGLPEDTTEV